MREPHRQAGAVSICTYADGKHHEEIFSSQENLLVFAGFGGCSWLGLWADEAGIILSRVFIQQRAKHKSCCLLELQPGNNGTNYYTNSSTIDIVEKRSSR